MSDMPTPTESFNPALPKPTVFSHNPEEFRIYRDNLKKVVREAWDQMHDMGPADLKAMREVAWERFIDEQAELRRNPAVLPSQGIWVEPWAYPMFEANARYLVAKTLLDATIRGQEITGVPSKAIIEEALPGHPAVWKNMVERIRQVLSDPELRLTLNGKTKSALYREADKLSATKKSLDPAGTYAKNLMNNLPGGEPKTIKAWCLYLNIDTSDGSEVPIDA